MISVTAGQDFTINFRVTESYPPNPTITLTTPGSVPTDMSLLIQVTSFVKTKQGPTSIYAELIIQEQLLIS